MENNVPYLLQTRCAAIESSANTLKRRFWYDQSWHEESIDVPYPVSYGFLVGTESEDGEECDVYILDHEGGLDDTIVTIIGGFYYRNNNDAEWKLIAIKNIDKPNFLNIRDNISDIFLYLNNKGVVLFYALNLELIEDNLT